MRVCGEMFTAGGRQGGDLDTRQEGGVGFAYDPDLCVMRVCGEMFTATGRQGGDLDTRQEGGKSALPTTPTCV